MPESTKKKRGRPKGSTNKRTEIDVAFSSRKTLRDFSPKKVCSCCQKLIASTNFYKSFSELSADGLSTFCKTCTVESCLDENRHVDVDKLRSVLQQMNRPFLNKVLDAAVSEWQNKYLHDPEKGSDQSTVVQIYMKNIGSLPQYSRLTYNQGLEMERIQSAGTDKAPEKVVMHREIKKAESEKPVYLDEEEDDAFEVTPEIVHRFGSGYTKTEYRCMTEKYAFLIQSYPDISNLHTEALVTYIRYKVKEELATAIGDVDSAEKWANLATKAADKAKINPSQLKEADLQNGLNSFSEIFQKVEQAKEILDISPFMYQPNDAPDMILYLVVAYMCSALGKPQPSYEEVYKFYDDRVAEYLAKNPSKKYLFKKDPSKRNRKEVANFIDISE